MHPVARRAAPGTGAAGRRGNSPLTGAVVPHYSYVTKLVNKYNYKRDDNDDDADVKSVSHCRLHTARNEHSARRAFGMKTRIIDLASYRKRRQG